MENIFSIGGLVALVYAVMKFIEMRFIKKETKPIKDIIKETILVYLSTVLGVNLFQHVNKADVTSENTNAFIGKPDF